MEPEDRDFFGIPSGLLIAFILTIAGTLALFIPRKVSQLPAPPWGVTGCYTATGAPEIFVESSGLHILQSPPVEIPYKLEYHKGWAITIDSWLEPQPDANGGVKIVPIAKSGEFLQLSRELEVASKAPGFNVLSRGAGPNLQYEWTGANCMATPKPSTSSL